MVGKRREEPPPGGGKGGGEAPAVAVEGGRGGGETSLGHKKLRFLLPSALSSLAIAVKGGISPAVRFAMGEL